MGVTVKVNGVVNSLAHKGAGHSSPATLPDVCKTPSPGGPVPIPYPNVTQAATLAKGTTTVKADGGNMVAIKGSEYAMSNGDEPGTVGGVKSSTFIKESTWISYSFDVKMEGKNACRLTDKKFQNHENTVDLAGDLGPIVQVEAAAYEFACAVKECDEKPLTDDEMAELKASDDPCLTLGSIKHRCVKEKMKDSDAQSEPGYDTGRNPPELLMRKPPNDSQPCPSFGSAFASVRRNCKADKVPYKTGRLRLPDCVIGENPPRIVLDAKFPCPDKVKKKPLRAKKFPSANQAGDELWRPGQREKYEKIAGKGGQVVAVSPKDVSDAQPPIHC